MTETITDDVALNQWLELDIEFAETALSTESSEILAGRLQQDEDRTLAFISRRIQLLLARKEPIDRQRDAMLEHYRSVADPLRAQIQRLAEVVEATLLERRRRNPDVKSLTLLGVGEWKSRKVGDGWDIDEKAALERLTPDERLIYVEQREHLKNAVLREHLDSLIAPAKIDITDAMDDDERIEQMSPFIEAIETQYGVKYRPARISVKGPLG